MFKYIIIETATGVEEPILFSPSLTHQEVSRAICRYFQAAKPVRAGFCFAEGDISAYGESGSLKLMSNPEKDSKKLSLINSTV